MCFSFQEKMNRKNRVFFSCIVLITHHIKIIHFCRSEVRSKNEANQNCVSSKYVEKFYTVKGFRDECQKKFVV